MSFELFNGIILPNGTKWKFKQAVSKKVVVADITIRNHPAYNRGRSKQLNARAAIKKDEFIGYYAGEIQYHPEDADEISYWGAYQLDPSPDSVYYVDAETIGNELRYMNDPKGLGEIKPNVKFFTARRKFKGFNIVEVQAIRDIKAGEEILVSYGPGYWKAIQKWYEQKTPHTCPKCDFRSHKSHAVRRHMVVHGDGVTRFKCEFCDTSYAHKQKLNYHVNREHTKQISYTCGDCEFSTFDPRTLDYHVKTSHEIPEFKCFECNEVFIDTVYLELHSRKMHGLINPHRCEICDITYVNGTVLKTHNRINHVKKSSPCQQCNHVAASVYELKQHVLSRHRVKKPYACKQCDKKYATNGELTRHSNIVHKKSVQFICAHCDFVTSYKDGLKRHIKRKHS